MSGVIFPPSPSVGDTVTGLLDQEWEWDGTKWIAIGVAAGGGASVVISETAPTNPSAGNLWWDPTGPLLYLWNGDEWVVVVNTPGGGGTDGGGGGGGVNAITAGLGLTGGTIIDSGTIALATPVTVANGGTGQNNALGARQALIANDMFLQFNWPGANVEAGIRRAIAPYASITTAVGLVIRYSWRVAPTPAGIMTVNIATQTGNTVSSFGSINVPNQTGFTAIGAGNAAFDAGTVFQASYNGGGGVVPDVTAADLSVMIQLARTA